MELSWEFALNGAVASWDGCAGNGGRCWKVASAAKGGGCSALVASRHAPITRRISGATQRGCYQRGRKWSRSMAATSSTNNSRTLEMESNAGELVDALLSLVDSSDRGVLLAEQERHKVEQIVGSLEQQCMPEPLKSPLLFGEWDVVYSSNPTSTGGYYRSALGRAFLNTKQMVQTVKEPDFVSNKVSFAALGILDGEVSLKGKLEALDNKWIKIMFESPELKLGFWEFQYGGESSVKIAIIYLDQRVRLGRGSRGSLFVFKRR